MKLKETKNVRSKYRSWNWQHWQKKSDNNKVNDYRGISSVFFFLPIPSKKKNIIPERSFANKKIHKHFFKWAESHNHENDDDDNYQDESSSSTNVSSDNDDHSNDSDSSSDESGAYESFDDDDSSNDSGDSEYVIDPYHQFENSAYKIKIE